MRRNVRRKTKNNDLSISIIKYSAIGVAILTVIVIGLLAYSKNLNDEVKEGTLTEEQISTILNQVNTSDNTESASTEIGKSVNEAKEEKKDEDKANNNANISNNNNGSKKSNTSTINKNVPAPIETESSVSADKDSEKDKKENQEMNLKFEKPVEGNIVKDFANESLIYSETLQEWTVHTGIDIKAEKTTIVKSAEAGTIKSIKNDPRYGLTITVEHTNGFETVYSNLLSSEFVVEGEKVDKGQPIGTVGNTAAFEISDEPHLHFEILKDLEYVDPNIYLKQ